MKPAPPVTSHFRHAANLALSTLGLLLPLMRGSSSPASGGCVVGCASPSVARRSCASPRDGVATRPLQVAPARLLRGSPRRARATKLVARLLARGGDHLVVDVARTSTCTGLRGAPRGRSRDRAEREGAEQLRENVRLNALENVVVCAAAASDSDGVADLAVPRTNDPRSRRWGRQASSRRACSHHDRRRGGRTGLQAVAVGREDRRTGSRARGARGDGADARESPSGAVRGRRGDRGRDRRTARRVAPVPRRGHAACREGLGDVPGYFNALFVPDGIR